ncbi:hypothetical protein QJS83_11480 [Bdellovibrio sp. 22V]|uniref:hypothetical protein n=1 Tax=Bdellovibrio TaxID=958 RepID=UPI002542C35B|nr:hypothetical protein [Bdellovibrio sp. 22V]WII71083.1 hypothetical protein QJS83_11480 [Bdellovibrio sp. 22V]
MRWKFKPVSVMKTLAAGLSVFTMTMSPVAEGAAASNQRKLINQYLKETGLTTKKMTVGEFWKMVRHVYPPVLQKQMDQWVAINRHEMMPSIEATSFKDADGKEQVRLTLTKDGQSSTLTFTNNEDNPLKVNGVSFSQKELLNYNSFNDLARKLSKQDPAIGKALKTGQQSVIGKHPVLTLKEYSALSPRQRAEYMIRMRLAMQAAEKVFEVRYRTQSSYEVENKYEYVLNVLFGDMAHAGALTGKPCIIAGYISKYGSDDSCGSERKGGALNADLRSKMSATSANCGGGVACNPLVYGFKDGGSSYCVPGGEVKYATRYCNGQSKLRIMDAKASGEDKKRIIESYLKYHEGKNVDLKLNEEGKISEEQKKEIAPFLSDLEGLIKSADAECKKAPLANIAKSREEQDSACKELQTRMFSLQTFAVKQEPPPPPGPLPEPPTQTCNDKTPGSTQQGKDCVCGEGSKKDENGTCVVIETGGSGDLPGGKETVKTKEDSCGFWCRNKNWIIPVGVGVLALGLFWWLFKDKSKAKSKDPGYTPPPPVPEPETQPTATPAPTVEPPPPAPSPSPTVPPVVVPPPVTTPTEGGSKVDEPGRAGGVR